MKAAEIQEDDTKKLYEASIRGCVTTLNILLQRDELVLDRTSLTFFKETPLHISCLLGHLDFTRAVLGHRPGLASVLDSQGHSPLHPAAAEGHTEIVKALLIVNPDACLIPNRHGLIPLHLAAMRGRIEVVQELVRACPESVQVKLQCSKETVLHLCVKYKQMDALKLLAKSMIGDRESLNSADSEGNTVWQLASMMKQTEAVRFLASIPEVSVETNAFLEIQDLEPTSERAVLSNGGQAAAAEPVVSKVTSYIQEKRGELMIVATVIASIAFQAAINPPGGVWQENQVDCNGVQGQFCEAGKSVLAYTDKHAHNIFMASNALCFCSCLGVIYILLVFPFKNRPMMALLVIVMGATMLFWTSTCTIGMIMVAPQIDPVFPMFIAYIAVWLGSLGLIFVFLVLRKLYVRLSHCIESRKAPADETPENGV